MSETELNNNDSFDGENDSELRHKFDSVEPHKVSDAEEREDTPFKL